MEINCNKYSPAAPKAGVAAAPKADGVAAAPNAEGAAPKAEGAAPKDGAAAPKAGVAVAPKAGVLAAPKAGVVVVAPKAENMLMCNQNKVVILLIKLLSVCDFELLMIITIATNDIIVTQ